MAELTAARIARYVSPDGREAKLMLPRPTAERQYAPPPSIDFYDYAVDQRVTFIFAEEA